MIDFYDMAIKSLVPNAQYAYSGGLIWNEEENNNIKCPTQEEISLKIEELKAAEPMRMLREKRDQLIAATDWRATVDYPGSDQAAWLTYRQALRDLPANSTPSLDENGQLTGVTWPTPPE